VQNHDKAGRWLKIIRHKREHPETTRIRPKIRGFNKGTVGARHEVPPKIRKAAEAVQFWQMSEEFDIFSEGHRQLLGRGFYNPTQNR
jgi:hypothetical protein